MVDDVIVETGSSLQRGRHLVGLIDDDIELVVIVVYISDEMQLIMVLDEVDESVAKGILLRTDDDIDTSE